MNSSHHGPPKSTYLSLIPYRSASGCHAVRNRSRGSDARSIQWDIYRVSDWILALPVEWVVLVIMCNTMLCLTKLWLSRRCVARDSAMVHGHAKSAGQSDSILDE
jgi:hypothetical protein